MTASLSDSVLFTKNSKIIAQTMANVVILSEDRKSLYIIDNYDYNDFKNSYDDAWNGNSGNVLYRFHYLNILSDSEVDVLKSLIRIEQYKFDSMLKAQKSEIVFKNLEITLDKAKFILNYTTDKNDLKLLLFYLNSTNYSFLSNKMISFLFENFEFTNLRSYNGNLESCLAPLKDYIMRDFNVENDLNFQKFYHVVDWMNDYDVSRSLEDVKNKENFLSLEHDYHIHFPNQNIVMSVFEVYDMYSSYPQDITFFTNYDDQTKYLEDIRCIYENMDKVSALEFYMFYAFTDFIASKNGYADLAEDIKMNRTLSNFVNKWGEIYCKVRFSIVL